VKSTSTAKSSTERNRKPRTFYYSTTGACAAR
jgi:hypothetical protein